MQTYVEIVTESFADAFRASRLSRPDHAARARQAAISDGALYTNLPGDSGSLIPDARDAAQDILIGQDFRAEAVSLFLDDLTTDAARLARQQREA